MAKAQIIHIYKVLPYQMEEITDIKHLKFNNTPALYNR